MPKGFLKYLIVVVFCLPLYQVYSVESLSDYDKLCSIITRVTSESNFHNLALDQQAVKVGDEIARSFSASSQIMSELSMLQLVDPGKKYALFKESAEQNLSRTWNCPAFKEFNESLLVDK